MNEIYILLQFFFTILNGVACAILCTFIIVNLYNPSADDWVQIYKIHGSDNIQTLTLAIVILGFIVFALNKVSSCFKKAPQDVFIFLVSMNMYQQLLPVSSLSSTGKNTVAIIIISRKWLLK